MCLGIPIILLRNFMHLKLLISDKNTLGFEL